MELVKMSGSTKIPTGEVWTEFFDLCSGGGEKLGFGVIYIQAKEDEAVFLFEKMFNRDPHNVTCSCCGPDYYVSEHDEDKFDDGAAIVSKKDIEKFNAASDL